MIEKLYWAVQRMLGRGLGRTQDDTQPIQFAQVQLNNNELVDKVPRIGEYGLASNPPDDYSAVMVFFGGDRANGVIIGTEHPKYRPTGLAKGESILYDNIGQSVYLSANGIIVTDKFGSTVKMNGDGTATLTFSKGLTIDANIQVNGTLNVSQAIVGGASITAATDVADQGGAKTMAGMRTVYNGHTHVVPGVATGTASVTSNSTSAQE